MNSLNLLSVDRALSDGKEVVGRFQMRDDALLPQFHGKPEASPESVKAEEAAEMRPVDPVAVPSNPVKRSMWRRFFGWVGRGDADVFRGGSATATGSETPGKPGPVKASGKSAEPRKRFAAFQWGQKDGNQAEFRFENVKVVCNDLSDTDFIIKTNRQKVRVQSLFRPERF